MMSTAPIDRQAARSMIEHTLAADFAAFIRGTEPEGVTVRPDGAINLHWHRTNLHAHQRWVDNLAQRAETGRRP